jgi:hypothetical protein
MRQTLIAASLIAVVLIVVVALLQTSSWFTGHAVDIVSGLGNTAAVAVGLGFVGAMLAFLWNKK